MPEEDGPEHIGRRGHAVVPAAVDIVPGAVHRAEDDHQHNQPNYQPEHPAVAVTVIIAGLIGGIGQGIVTRAEIGVVEVVEAAVHAEDTRLIFAGAEVPAQILLHEGIYLAVRQHGGKVVAGGQIVALIRHRNHQHRVVFAHTQVGAQLVGVIGKVVQSLHVGGHGLHGHHAHHAVVPVIPVGVVEGDGLLGAAREQIRAVIYKFGVIGGVQPGVQGPGLAAHCCRGLAPHADTHSRRDGDAHYQYCHAGFLKNLHDIPPLRGLPLRPLGSTVGL